MGVIAFVTKLSIPQGLIFPYNDTTIPNGWERFTAPDDKFIIGAGSTYNPGDTGGDSTASLSALTSSADGAHTGNSGTDFYTTSGAGAESGGSSSGDHSHDFTSNDIISPDYRQMLLIKASSGRARFPANACPLWHDSTANPTGLTQVHTADNDKMFRAGNSIGTGGDNQLAVTTTSEGVHTHGTLAKTGSATQVFTGSNAGAHTHDVDVTITFNPKELLLGLWTDAVSQFNIEANMIGMYESLTPPDGWVLCNGSNGSPDMRDYFLGVADQANQGLNQGDNSLSGVTPSHDWTHNHQTILFVNEGGGQTWMHSSQSHPHTHSLSMNTNHYFPPYYALSFIMYTG